MSQTIQFTDDEWETYHALCHKYAHDELESTFAQRAKRNQTNKDAMIAQVTCGKMAEWAVTMCLLDQGYDVTEPDMKIYTASKKSFDADLTVDGAPLHVKSQSVESARRFGTSWMFQYGGRGYGHKDPLIDKVDENVALCVVDFTNRNVVIHGIFPFEKLRGILKEPVKLSLKKTKRCVYLKDLNLI